MSRSHDELVSLLERLGAPDPAAWAGSETKEEIPQLLRFLALRGMWATVLADGSTSWIKKHIAAAKRAPGGPLSGVGTALERILAKGVDPRDLSDVVRGMQFETLDGIAYLLDDPTPAFDDVRDSVPELETVAWRLWEEDAEGRPIRPIEGLHESALSTDPTGREMRPREGS